MEWLNSEKIGWALVGFLAAIVVSSGNVKADFTFGEPANLGPTVNTEYVDGWPSISSDGLSLFFDSENRPGGFAGGLFGADIWFTTRDTLQDEWGEPINMGAPVNSSVDEGDTSISTDGLSLYFWSLHRPGGLGGDDIWLTTRPSKSDPWTEPVNLGPQVNSSAHECAPCISADGLSLYFHSNRSDGHGDFDIWVTRRATKNDSWGEPENLGPVVNSDQRESDPYISSDGRILLFSREDTSGEYTWMTKRATTSDSWGPPIKLPEPINMISEDGCAEISADGSMLYFQSRRPGGYGSHDIWKAPIIPIVDFNGDGIVDATDMCIMVGHWGEDYSLCDIGPMPWGDGFVDVEDMKVLSKHLFADVGDPTLIAHWPLDEVQGLIAYNNAADCDGTLTGDPVWQPHAGMIDGALELDGINDYVVTDYVLDPTNGPFSVFAWIKGGASGQVVISQLSIANWLALDTEGNLMTELKTTGRSAGPLFSETIITDGQWHRIGLVWDGLNRMLYVDGIMVAEDTPNGLVDSNNNLYVGCGKTMKSGTFFSGLIDDIRIYNRAVLP